MVFFDQLLEIPAGQSSLKGGPGNVPLTIPQEPIEIVPFKILHLPSFGLSEKPSLVTSSGSLRRGLFQIVELDLGPHR